METRIEIQKYILKSRSGERENKRDLSNTLPTHHRNVYRRKEVCKRKNREIENKTKNKMMMKKINEANAISNYLLLN